MRDVVVDTNILVSALIVPGSKPDQIVEMALTSQLNLCYSDEILAEYELVLFRPKFNFNQETVKLWLNCLTESGRKVSPTQSVFEFQDESDRKFYDVAKTCNAYLITGNIKHYPTEPFILLPAQFLQLFM